MGEFYLSGPNAVGVLERTMTNSAARIRAGKAYYTLMCNRDGGTIDDLIIYRLGEDEFMLCVNAGNIDCDREWLLEAGAARAGFEDRSEQTALIAIQGPAAAAIAGYMADFDIASIPRFGVGIGNIAGIRCICARTGYTGEDGFEIFCDVRDARALFASILEAGRPRGMVPVGLGARDTLRLEAGLPLYGHELDPATTPLDAGLGNYVKMGRGFIGEDAIAAEHRAGIRKRLIGLVTADAKTVARAGYPIMSDGRRIGSITSGTFAPWIGRPVAMGYVARDSPVGIGDHIEVEVRGRIAPGYVVALPFYRRSDPPGFRSESK
jgi:aminomethyltransferase